MLLEFKGKHRAVAYSLRAKLTVDEASGRLGSVIVIEWQGFAMV